jgi:hypothetical protein
MTWEFSERSKNTRSWLSFVTRIPTCETGVYLSSVASFLEIYGVPVCKGIPAFWRKEIPLISARFIWNVGTYLPSDTRLNRRFGELANGWRSVQDSSTLNMEANRCGETKAPSTILDGITPQPKLNFRALVISNAKIWGNRQKDNIKIYTPFCGDTAQAAQHVLKVQ